MNIQTDALKKCRLWLGLFIAALVLSGLTAIPLEWELGVLAGWFGVADGIPDGTSGMALWIGKIHEALMDVLERYPFIGYGFDWLAFGHLMIALAMVGAWIDPVRNRWLFTFAKLACLLVIPWALAFGELRGIPIAWRLIDCSFGVFGLVPLFFAERAADRIEGTFTSAGGCGTLNPCPTPD